MSGWALQQKLENSDIFVDIAIFVDIVGIVSMASLAIFVGITNIEK